MKRLALLLLLPMLVACGQEGSDMAAEQAGAESGDCPSGYTLNASGLCTPIVPAAEE